MDESGKSFDILHSDVTEKNDDIASGSMSENQEMDDEAQIQRSDDVKSVESRPLQKILDADHPLMIKYQKDLKGRLLKLLQEADEQLVDLKRTIAAQEQEVAHFALRGYDLQKELKDQEEKLTKVHEKFAEQVEIRSKLLEKCKNSKESFQSVDKVRHDEVKNDLEFQKELEDIAFEVVQLTSLQTETYTDAKSLKRAVEKTTKDRENLELHKLRQDLLICRLENDKFNLEDKINLYKTQWAIKKEEANDLRKELHAAEAEMQSINFEKQQIVHQWRQSLASLEKQDHVLAEIRESVRVFEDDMCTLHMDITAYKKSVRKELERNELLTLQLQFRESDIARIQKELKDVLDCENNLQEDLSIVAKIIDITDHELKFLNDNKILKEKELEAKEKEIQKAFGYQKQLEGKHMDILHEKITATKASKYTEKLIKDIRNSISINEDKGSKKEREKEKLLLELDNLQTYVSNMEANLSELQKESKKREELMNKSEINVFKAREKMDLKRGEYRALETDLQEMINQAGGQELAPFERELANLRREINVAEQGKRDMEQEYLRFQRELFSFSKQSSVKSEENDLYKKKLVIMEGKKIQLVADITREEKDIKETENRIQTIKNDLTRINKLLSEKIELQEDLQQASELSKSDFVKLLKEAQLYYVQKQTELVFLRKKKKKHFHKLIEAQKQILYWEGKVYLAEETRRVLKSDAHLDDLSKLRSEIRRLQLKQDQIKKDQDTFVQEMQRAVYRHTSLYIEADKQALFGKRRKTPDYIMKKITTNIKKVQEDKKMLGNSVKQIEALKISNSELESELENESLLVLEMMNKINAIEYDTDNKMQEKRQAVIKLSLKQTKTKLLQKVKDGTYIRAVRNEERRPEEIEKLQRGLCAVQVIVQAAMNEYPDLVKDLSKIIDYIIVSKQF